MSALQQSKRARVGATDDDDMLDILDALDEAERARHAPAATGAPRPAGKYTGVHLRSRIRNGELDAVARFVPVDPSRVGISSGVAALPPNSTDLPSLLQAASLDGTLPLGSLTIVDGFATVVEQWEEREREALLLCLQAGEAFHTLEFRTSRKPGAPPASSATAHDVTPTQRRLHSAWLISLMQLPSLTSLSAPHLSLPPEENDLSILGLLPLQHLKLGKGVAKSAETLATIAQMPTLRSLEWSGWSSGNFKEFLAASPPALQKLVLDSEPLGLTLADRLCELSNLQHLVVRNVSQWLGKFAHTLFMGLKKCEQLHTLELQLEQNEIVTEGSSVASVYRELLCLHSLRHLGLGGSALSSLFLTGLVTFSVSSDSPNSPTTTSPSGIMQLSHLTLYGADLMRFNWSNLLRETGRDLAGVRSPVASWGPVGGWQMRSDARGGLMFLGSLQRLTLVDCRNHGALLPYLSLLPALRELEMISSQTYTGDPLAHASLPVIRTLDFLSLAACKPLKRVRCHYPIRPDFRERDPDLCDRAAVAELRKAKKAALLQAHSPSAGGPTSASASSVQAARSSSGSSSLSESKEESDSVLHPLAEVDFIVTLVDDEDADDAAGAAARRAATGGGGPADGGAKGQVFAGREEEPSPEVLAATSEPIAAPTRSREPERAHIE